jgi:hypothetical protein
MTNASLENLLAEILVLTQKAQNMVRDAELDPDQSLHPVDHQSLDSNEKKALRHLWNAVEWLIEDNGKKYPTWSEEQVKHRYQVTKQILEENRNVVFGDQLSVNHHKKKIDDLLFEQNLRIDRISIMCV